MVTMDKIVSLCKRRGFIFPGSEIYGGLANTWDYGPYGVELKNELKRSWWDTFVKNREDVVGIDCAILMNPKVWEASGHVTSFSDPLIDCKNCKERFRGDKLLEEKIQIPYPELVNQHLETWSTDHKNNKKNQNSSAFKKNQALLLISLIKEDQSKLLLEALPALLKHYEISCPNCKKSTFTPPRSFNLMFKTFQGVIEESGSQIFLRPETAQGIFVNFKNVLGTTRKKLPFGIAQIGKAFRNEITPGNFTFRTREFEQMEIEYFIKPGTQHAHFNHWCEQSFNWFVNLGVKKENLRFREHTKQELSHYSEMTSDIEFKFPFGWGELTGIAYRGNFDLTQHQKFSSAELSYLDSINNQKFLPHVIEPSFGVDRAILTHLLSAYSEETVNGELRVVLHLNKKLSPVKVAVLPLSQKLADRAKDVFNLIKNNFTSEYDESGSIGKRYRRQDEIGTPYCVTIDFETETDQKVTIRDRDSMQQDRVSIDNLNRVLLDKLISS